MGILLGNTLVMGLICQVRSAVLKKVDQGDSFTRS